MKKQKNYTNDAFEWYNIEGKPLCKLKNGIKLPFPSWDTEKSLNDSNLADDSINETESSKEFMKNLEEKIKNGLIKKVKSDIGYTNFTIFSIFLAKKVLLLINTHKNRLISHGKVWFLEGKLYVSVNHRIKIPKKHAHNT